MLNPSKCANGCEQHEKFKRNGKTFVQYDYRDEAGLLFSCVGKSLAECQAKAVAWQKKNEEIQFGKL
jgi:hypothetical protein